MGERGEQEAGLVAVRPGARVEHRGEAGGDGGGHGRAGAGEDPKRASGIVADVRIFVAGGVIERLHLLWGAEGVAEELSGDGALFGDGGALDDAAQEQTVFDGIVPHFKLQVVHREIFGEGVSGGVVLLPHLRS
jgi:hypothetical protein